jgi:hypothetical protein
MAEPLDAMSCARLPASALALLAELRCARGVDVVIEGENAWVRWPPGNEEVLRRVFSAQDVQLYSQREGLWYRAGCRLPTMDVPLESKGQALQQVVIPAACQPERANRGPVTPIPLQFVRDARPRRATALRCTLAEMGRWADRATTAELQSVSAALLDDNVLLRGKRLPALPRGDRFWGNRVLVLLGLRPEPDLPESALRKVLRMSETELALLEEKSVELVPSEALQPLSRAAIRLALRERAR